MPHSFWSERNAGWLVRRLQSWKNPCYSIVKDYTKVEFIERARAMYPHAFRHEDELLHHEANLSEEPDYLSEEIVVRLSGEGVVVTLDADDESAFDTFLRENKYQAQTGVIRSHEQVVLNSFRIRTSTADAKVQTSDSVICARVGEAVNERYACLILCVGFLFICTCTARCSKMHAHRALMHICGGAVITVGASDLCSARWI
jgi:hypothetical protein